MLYHYVKILLTDSISIKVFPDYFRVICESEKAEVINITIDDALIREIIKAQKFLISNIQ
jgi:hypothetical protein